jgi:hypothetical protein
VFNGIASHDFAVSAMTQFIKILWLIQSVNFITNLVIAGSHIKFDYEAIPLTLPVRNYDI